MGKQDYLKEQYSFWKENGPTRNLLVILLFTYTILAIISLSLYKIEYNLSYIFSLRNEILSYIAQSNEKVLNGYIYQILTSIIVHFNIVHLFSNFLFLLIFGLRAEENILNSHFYIIFFVSGILSNLLTLLFYPLNTLSCGASGSIFGLLGVDIILGTESDSSKSFWIYLAIGIIFIIISVGVNVNTLAHTIGFFTGVIMTKFVFKKRKQIENTNE